MFLLLLAACGGTAPTSWEECAGLSSERERLDCWTQTLPTLACTDPTAARKALKEQVPVGADRDFILYTVVSRAAPEDASFCKLIDGAPLQRRCMEVVQRPHLHDELTKDSCPSRAKRGGPGGGPPGGTPPGGMPPGGMPPGGAPPGGASPGGASPGGTPPGEAAPPSAQDGNGAPAAP